MEENENFIKGFAETFFLAFGRMPKIYFDKYNNSFVAYVHSKEIWNYLANVMEIPKGTKSQIVRIPDEVKHSNEEIKCALISGLFDAEGSVIKMKDPIHHPKGYLKIQFKVHNKDLARDVYDILIELGFKPRLYNYNEFSMVNLHGRSQGKLFIQKVGFRHPAKNAKISAFPLTK
ncbi:TPA: hypothetical protein HA238_01740 [Candidatus Micrarchaeota archaeon]|nr:hypothetical protein [Candidatus Micrarchaeota archaeon]